MSFVETELPNRSVEISRPTNERNLIGWNPAGITKEKIKQKIKVSTVDIDIKDEFPALNSLEVN